METIPVLYDTDIGSDIDDAVALAYLVNQPRCELLGVTTVTGETAKRASLVDAVCRAGGREDIPIHVGVEGPLLVKQRQPHAPHFEALTEKWPHRPFPSDNTAVNFLRDTIRARPGEITLLTTGPLTNAALLFAMDPEIPSLLKQHVLMGGEFFGRGSQGVAEWNILCDPHAAAMVFAAPVPKVTAIGLDVTERCVLSADECRNRFRSAGGPLAPVADMAEVWFRHSPYSTFHDPIAAAIIFEPSLCEMKTGRIAVELVSPYSIGQTLLFNDAQPHTVAKTIDPAKFFEHYFEVVGG